MLFTWNNDKNEKLIEDRGFSFEDIEEAVRNGKLISIQKHSNTIEYKHQMVMIVEVKGYLHKVPCIVLQESPKIIYMVTAFKDRKLNKKYNKVDL